MALGAVPTFEDVNTKTPIDHTPTSQGGSVHQAIGEGELDVAANLQLEGAGGNMFQEVNMFVGEVCRKYVLAPRAAILRLQLILAQLNQGSAGLPPAS